MTHKKLVLALIATGLSGGALLQSAAAAELEEITVTATKRERSISAITGDSLERNGIADFTDIATSVPSVSFRSSGPGRTKLNVRGISAATGVAPTVSFYIDEAPIQTISSGSTTSFAQAIVDPKMYDLERVEVLRGPQGTLYGSSSMGGTIRLITRQPVVGEFQGSAAAEVSSTAGGGTNFRINGMVNAPIADTAALRIVASLTDNDGYFDRVSDSTDEVFAKNVNTEETVSVRAALRWDITDNAYIQPYVFHQTTEMDGKPNFDGPLTDDKQFAPFDAAEPFDDEFTMTSLTYGHDFSALSLLATYSQIDRKLKNLEDITTGADAIFGVPNPTPAFSDELVDLDDETIEVRLTSSSDSSLQWLVGYYRKDAVADAGYRMGPGWNPLDIDDDGEPDVFFNGLANTQKLSDYTEDAFFGELTYNFNDSWAITAGLRSLDYDFRSREENWGFAFNNDGDRSTANVRDAVISDSGTNEKLALTYAFGDDNQVYVSAATGSRPGAINRVIPRSDDPAQNIGFACNQDLIAYGIDDPGAYLGDEVTSTEFGWKLLFNDSVRLNGAVYDVKWEDIQQLIFTSSGCGNNFTGNLGEASSTGVELELTAAVTDNLTLSANLGYIDAQFEETLQSPDGSVQFVTKGDQLPDVPELSYNVAFDYTIPANSGEFYVLGSVNYVDETLEIPGSADTDVSGPGIDSTNVRPDYTIVDARIGYISESGWEASIFADNLFDEEALYGFNDAIAFNFPDVGDPTVRNRPRTIGVSFQYNFD
jgi:outer membrane receptor protein involved in Fe transport